MLVIISDTSVLSNFLHLNRLDILQSLYEEIYIPPAVLTEINQLFAQNNDNNPIEKAKWLQVKHPANSK